MRSGELARHLGITYRQIDWVSRTGGVVEGQGSGSLREWGPQDVRRLEVARDLSDATGRTFTPLGRIALAGPVVPDEGWAVLVGERIGYLDDTEVIGRLAEGLGGVYVPLRPLSAPLAERMAG